MSNITCPRNDPTRSRGRCCVDCNCRHAPYRILINGVDITSQVNYCISNDNEITLVGAILPNTKKFEEIFNSEDIFESYVYGIVYRETRVKDYWIAGNDKQGYVWDVTLEILTGG